LAFVSLLGVPKKTSTLGTSSHTVNYPGTVNAGEQLLVFAAFDYNWDGSEGTRLSSPGTLTLLEYQGASWPSKSTKIWVTAADGNVHQTAAVLTKVAAGNEGGSTFTWTTPTVCRGSFIVIRTSAASDVLGCMARLGNGPVGSPTQACPSPVVYGAVDTTFVSMYAKRGYLWDSKILPPKLYDFGAHNEAGSTAQVAYSTIDKTAASLTMPNNIKPYTDVNLTDGQWQASGWSYADGPKAGTTALGAGITITLGVAIYA
jgi:hypothetical protein